MSEVGRCVIDKLNVCVCVCVCVCARVERFLVRYINNRFANELKNGPNAPPHRAAAARRIGASGASP